MKISLKHTTIAALITLQAVATPALASSRISNEKAAEVRAALTEQGYEVRKIEMEDGNFEAYAIKDGKKFEIYLDANLKIVNTKSAD